MKAFVFFRSVVCLPRVVRAQDLAVLSLVMLLCTERAAHAYVDPGSGLLAIQAIIAGVAGLLYVIRRSVVRAFRACWQALRRLAQRPDRDSHEA